MKAKEIEPEYYSQDEVDDLQEWMDNLTIRQAFFLKDTYESFLKAQATEAGSAYVH